MHKQVFFHQNLTGIFSQLKSLGVSLLIEVVADQQLRVTHVYCGRNEKEFSKRVARELLRDYQQSGKNTVTVYLSGLPTYMADLVSRCYKKPAKVYTMLDYRGYAFRFVPKEN